MFAVQTVLLLGKTLLHRKSRWWFPHVHRISHRLPGKLLLNGGWLRLSIHSEGCAKEGRMKPTAITFGGLRGLGSPLWGMLAYLIQGLVDGRMNRRGGKWSIRLVWCCSVFLLVQEANFCILDFSGNTHRVTVNGGTLS